MNEIISYLCDGIVEFFKDSTSTVIKQKKFEDKIVELGDSLGAYEHMSQEEFVSEFEIVFSKENMLKLSEKLTKLPGYAWRECIEQNLNQFFENVEIDQNRIAFWVTSFTNMIQETISKEETQNTGIMMFAQEQAEIIQKEGEQTLQTVLKTNQLLERLEKKFDTSFKIPDKTSKKYDDVEDIHDNDSIHWNLDGSYNRRISENTSIEKIRLLSEIWGEERKRYPGWYIVPFFYREKLKSSIRGEELLVDNSDISQEDRLHFLYELVWRQDKGFVAVSDYYMKRALEIWMTSNLPKDENIIEEWCYISIFFLKQYRERMDWEHWQLIYTKIFTVNPVEKIKEELFIEKIYADLYKMNLGSVCAALNSVDLSEYTYANQMKLISLMAENGITANVIPSIENLIILIENELDDSQITHERKIYLSSLLACTWHLKGFLLQAIRGINDKIVKQVKCCYQKRDELKDYFSYEKEKDYCTRVLLKWHERKSPKYLYELNRERETIIGSVNDCPDAYGFYKMLEAAGLTMRIGHVGLIGEFEESLLEVSALWNRKLFWLWIIRSGNSKHIENCLTRYRLASWDRKNKDEFFEYAYHTIIDNLDQICSYNNTWKYGNIFTSIICTCPEILVRLASVANIKQQRMLLHLMTVLINKDVLHEFRKMNEFIYSVMHAVSDKSKALMLNALLECSTKERERIEKETQLDPFDAFDYKEQSRSLFEKSKVDSILIDELFALTKKSDTDRKNACARLGQLSTFGMLSKEQNREFGKILWSHTAISNGLPDMEQYYYFVFLKWPSPNGLDVDEKIQEALAFCETKQDLREEVNIHSLMPSNYLNQLVGYNTNKVKKWRSDYLEAVMELLFKQWQYIKMQSVSSNCNDILYKNFIRRGNQLIRVFESFSSEDIKNISDKNEKNLRVCLKEMSESGIATYEADLVILKSEDAEAFINNLVDELYSSNREISVSASRALEKYIIRTKDEKTKWDLFVELLKVIRSRKEPGLQAFIISAHNVFYRNTERMPDKIMKTVEKTLLEIAEQTEYYDQEMEENELKKKLEIRSQCAGLAYQVYCYEKKFGQDDTHSAATIIWRELCIGEKSNNEFSEVRNEWCYED